MSRLVFFDTNVLLYCDDLAAPGKRARALELVDEHLRTRTLAISLQVLQEYFAAATRKLRLSAGEAQRKVELLSQAHVVRFAPADVISAIELHRLHAISFWDALIVHAARLSGAKLLLSEDLQTGASLAGVRLNNPFLS